MREVKTFAIFSVFCFLAPLGGARREAQVRLRPASGDPVQLEFRAWLGHGVQLYSSGQYEAAETQFQAALGAARAVGDDYMAGKANIDLGSLYLSFHRFRKSLEFFLRAERFAENAHDSAGLTNIKVDIASLYSEIGDVDRAAQRASDALNEMKGGELQSKAPQMEIELAILRAQQKDRFPEALQLFWKGIEESYRAKDWDTYGKAWNRLGDAYLKRMDLFGENRLAEAEKPLEEALKVRLDHRLAPETAYRSLGRLRLEQGRLGEAAELLDRAIALSLGPHSGLPSWDAYQYRGLVRMKQGDLRGALADLRIAVRLARDTWRGEAPPDERALMAAESKTNLGRVHAAFVDAANLLYSRTGERQLLREGFEAAEENRANSSLRPAPESLPDAYWSALDRLRRTQTVALRQPGYESAVAAQKAQAAVNAIEASLDGGWVTPSEGVLAAIQAKLDSQTALLTFSEGAQCVWMWAVDRSRISLYQLPAVDEIRRLNQRTLAAIGDNSPELRTAGGQLYGAIFGKLDAEYRQKQRWLLALDESLFAIPFGALPEGIGPHAPYVVERHTLEIVPGAAHWLAAHRRPARRLNPTLVAVGDPIYNAADPRLKGLGNGGAPSPFQLTAYASSGLPRLVGSGVEVGACVRNWGKKAVVLEGAEANRNALLQELAKSPAAVHIATHVIESSSVPPQGLIAFSLGKNGAPDLLTPGEIESWRFDLGLVVLSGCASASPASARSGSGLLGLTRAWLGAGAREVIAARWNVPDESGALFASLYSRLGAAQPADRALALQYAQLEMLRSSGWRSQPRYWGAYFAIGKE